jgi:hypothetical protein
MFEFAGFGNCCRHRSLTVAAQLVFFVSLCLSGSMLAQAASFSFPARHEHLRSGCAGKLTIGETEISFESPKHSFHWPYLEVQQLRLLENGRVDLLTYENGPKVKLGADRTFHFQAEGDLREAAEFLRARLDQRLVSGFAGKPGKLLAQFAVKHPRPFGGDNGTLFFGEDQVVFQSEDKAESRAWRYKDIESISTSGPFQLSITTYERQKLHYATRRTFNFQLKQPISEETYNRLWRRVNRVQGLELLER